jgi:hypothetical protein
MAQDRAGGEENIRFHFDSARLIADLLRLHNEATYATMCKRKNEAIQTQIPYVRVG